MHFAVRQVTNINLGVARAIEKEIVIIETRQDKKRFEIELHVLSNA
jgi:hypothetical protein